MDMMTDLAAMAMEMKTTQYQQSYDVAVTKKAMNTQEEMAAKMVNDMMPQAPQVPKGEFLDVYA